MVGLAEGWESDYDGKRWFYRYKATGTVQYHFPQPGDEFAEYFLDSGAGPLQLTPEESLAVEQAKRTSPSISDNSTRGTKTNGRKNTEADEEHGMSATGYFDPSSFEYFPGVHKDAGPTTSDGRNTPGNGAEASYAAESSPYPPVRNPNQTEKAPSAGQQTWSPVGHVAELATMETVKCAEELAPVELDSTSVAMPSIHTDISQQSAELSTHRIPAKKTPDPDPEPTRPVMEPVDSYPLTSASFAYPPLKGNVQHGNEASSSSASRFDDTAFQNASQQSTAGTQTSSEEVNVVVAYHEGSHVSSTLTPGGGQSNNNLQETQETPNPKPPHQFIPNAQGSVSSHPLHKTEVQVPHRHHSQPSVSTMKVSSDGLVSAMPSPPTANGSPGFLLFHEIPTTSNLSLDSTAIHTNRLPSRPTQASHDSDHGRISPQAPPVSVDLAMSKPQDLSHAATRPQSAAPKPSLQQAAARPPMGYQGSVPGPTQPPQQSPYQHPAALAQSVSPLPSQVSSPATSIASLHTSQSSTPSNPSANISAPTSSNSRPNSSIHQMPNAPLRPSSIAPLQGVNQQTGNNSRPQSNSTPTSRPPAGTAQARPSSMASFSPASLPAKPFPMLPGQVTPLPSQVGSNPVLLPMPQPASNNHIKPPGNMQSAGAGQHPAQATSVGMAQHHVPGGHVNPTQNSQNSSQGPMKPSQPQPQSSSIPPGATQIGRPQQAAKPPQQQTGSYHQQQAVYGQPPMSQQPVVSPPTSKPPVVVHNTFPPPPVGPAPSPVQLQSITSGQATAVIADAGKGMKKLAKKLFQSPAIKQTTAVIGGAWPRRWESTLWLEHSLRIASTRIHSVRH
ncbi:hypothetical protein GGR50DRAFT_485063 [Xylaria sp. CBS 124048]|nr:hypothetical protein GGR50DRAFT_485063 [Xylaria sp. CBS 124048]